MTSTMLQVWALVLGLGAAPAAAASSGPVVGVVVAVKGEPRLDGKPLKKNAFVYAGSALETRAGSCAALALVTGAEVRFNENSEVRIDRDVGRLEGSVSLSKGQIWVRVIHGKSGLRIHGPHAVVSVGAAQADVAVGSRTVVKVYEGEADVANGSGKQLVAADHKAQVDGPGQAPSFTTALSPQEIETWQDGCAGVDRASPVRSSGPSLRIRPKPVAPRP